MDKDSSSRLLRRVADGDRSAYAELVDGTAPAVYGLVSRIVTDAQTADEVLLEVYTEACRTAGAYDPERATALQWIAGIARSRAIVRRFEAATSTLSPGSLAREVPDHLRDLILLRLEQEPEEAAPRAAAPGTDRPPDGPKPAAEPPVEPKATVPTTTLKLTPPPQHSGGKVLPWVAALLLLAAAAFMYYRWKQADGNNTELQRMVVAAQGDAQQLRSMLELERVRTRELEQLSTAISTPGSRIIHLVGQEAAPTASAAVFWDVQNNRCTVTGHLPPPPSGRTYQLWFVAPAGRSRAAALKTGADGHVFAVVEVPPSIEKISGAVISLEAESGASQPTMPFHAVGRLLP